MLWQFELRRPSIKNVVARICASFKKPVRAIQATPATLLNWRCPERRLFKQRQEVLPLGLINVASPLQLDLLRVVARATEPDDAQLRPRRRARNTDGRWARE